MRLGSINNPHLLIWSLVLHQRKHVCDDGERPVWRVPTGGQVQCDGLAPHRSTELGSSPSNMRTRERVN